MSKHKTPSELLEGWKRFKRPKDGQIFLHYKGGIYEIVATGYLEASEEPCVIYRSKENNTVWVRTAKDFLETVDYQSVIQPRFKSI